MTDLANYSVKILDKEFEGDVSKEVYLDACKWLAKNVYSSPSYSDNISVQIKKSIKEIEKEKLIRHKKTGKIEKVKEKQTRTVFTVSLYCVRSLDVALDEHCKTCKHLHNLFFQMNDLHCEECKVVALQKKLEREIVGLADSLKKSFSEGEQND